MADWHILVAISVPLTKANHKCAVCNKALGVRTKGYTCQGASRCTWAWDSAHLTARHAALSACSVIVHETCELSMLGRSARGARRAGPQRSAGALIHAVQRRSATSVHISVGN